MNTNLNKFQIAEQVYSRVAKDYANVRPRYPSQLFSFLSSLTPTHDLVWDVGTGNGQAAVQISEYYKKVIGTDISEEQLQRAEQRPNITYAVTPPLMTDHHLHSIVGPQSSVDLVTVATAVHWFDLGKFYAQVKRVLKNPGGVIAVWVYTKPTVNPAVDAVFERFFAKIFPFFHPSAKWVFDEYRTLPFPFAEAESIKLEIEEERTLQEYLGFFRTWSALVVTDGLLNQEFRREFEAAWGGPPHVTRTVKFPLFLKVGKV